jgi:hypothetical protein
MKKKQIVLLVCLLIISLSPCTTSVAQESSCVETDAMAGMANAKSSAALVIGKRNAGDSYRAKVVFAFRLFELHPADPSAASAALHLIPQNQDQNHVWHSFNIVICQSESEKDMRTLGRLGADLPRDLAKAVLLVPDRMLGYVSYAYVSVEDPNSDYAIQMQRVCRSKHQRFVTAVDQLPPNDKKWLLANVFNPDGCHVLRLPEQ